MTAKTAKLINRFENENGELIIRAGLGGKYFDVKVSASDRDEAGEIRGNGDVHFEYRGGKAFYVNNAEWYGDDD